MLQHNTVVSGFILVNDENTNQALAAAKAKIGDAEWKSGYSEEKCKIARAMLKEHRASCAFKLEGRLTRVSTAETKDAQGNTFRKVRVTLGEGRESTILSLDVGTEFCERLLPKLGAAVVQLGIGAQVSITCFPDVVERDGRTFVNHVASLKDAQGNQVKATKPHFRMAQDAAQAAVEALQKAGIKDRKALNMARESAKEEYFFDLAQKLEGFFPVQPETKAAA